METKSTLVIFALIAGLGLMAVVGVNVMLTAQEAEARGCSGTSPAFNASLGRCFKPDIQSADEQTVEDQVEDEEDAEPSNEETTAEEEREVETEEEIQEESEEE